MSQLFIQDGDQYLMTAGGVVIISADTIYGPPEESTDAGRANAKAIMDAILTVATERGFTRRDIFETMLALRQITPRAYRFALEVDKCLGSDGFQLAMDRSGVRL